MEKLDVEFELFRKRVYNLEIRSFYLLLLNRGCDIKTLKALFSDVDEKLAIFLRIFFACNASSLFSIIFTLSPFCAYIITNFLSQYTPYKKSIISQTLILPHISCIIDQFYVILTNPNQFQRFKYVYPFFK